MLKTSKYYLSAFYIGFVFGVTPSYSDSLVGDFTQRSNHSWVERNYKDVNKQMIDTSCGAASVANILIKYYGRKISEFTILKETGINKTTYSIKDLEKVVNKIGFKAVLFAMDYDALLELKIPVIIHYNGVKDGHFVVLRTINSRYVTVADPAWGNRMLTRSQFEKLWASKDGMAKGMAILRSMDDKSPPQRNYFGNINDNNRRTFFINQNEGF